MEKKIYRSPIELKAEGEETGEFTAIFSTFNVIDLQGDVTLPGAFKDGQTVRISYWGHRWEDLPVGRGVIHADDEKAWVDGKFFLDTDAGMETYKTVKNLGDLQEYSYGFDIDQADDGVFEGIPVRFLKALTVYEVSPVFLGAGIGTGTVAIKSAGSVDGTDDKSGVTQDPDGTHEEPGDGTDKKSGVTPEVVLTEIEILNSLGG